MTPETQLAVQPQAFSHLSTENLDAIRAMKEVEGQIVMAKKFPRDLNRAIANIMTACKRPVLAEQAEYAYPRGGEKVTGPSIRLAEVLAQNYGNLDFGIRELEQHEGWSKMQSYCWDLETNVRRQITFDVVHERHLKTGQVKALTDPRDIYEMNANNASRRLRACILAVIPTYITEEAVIMCQETLKNRNASVPVEDLRTKMILQFKEIGVSPELLEKKLAHKIDQTTREEMVEMGRIFLSIRDKQSKISDWFNLGDGSGDAPPADPKRISVKNARSTDDTQNRTEEGPKSKGQARSKSEPAPEPQQSAFDSFRAGPPLRNREDVISDILSEQSRLKMENGELEAFVTSKMKKSSSDLSMTELEELLTTLKGTQA